MRIVRLVVDNFLKIEHLEVNPGVVTILEGGNDVGKTSTLRALRAALSGGHDPTVIRDGAACAVVTVVFDDKTEVEAVIRPKKTDRTVRVSVNGSMAAMSKPQAFIDSLVDPLGVDPMAVIHCPASKRAEFFSEILNPDVTLDELRDAAQGEEPGDPNLVRLTGLERIEAFRKTLFDERTGVNRIAKEKRATAKQLGESLPPKVDEATKGASALREEKAALDKEWRAKEAISQQATRKRLDDLKAYAQAQIDLARKDAAERIAAIEREREEIIAKLKDSAESDAETIHREGAAGLAAIGNEVGPRLEALAADIARAEEREAAEQRAVETRNFIARSNMEADAAEKESARISAAIDGLDELKRKKTEAIPIKGLAIQGKDVLVDGRPFDNVNRARQMRIGFELATLRAGKVGLIVADELESVAEGDFERDVVKAAQEAKVQCFYARVTKAGEPLNVRTEPKT